MRIKTNTGEYELTAEMLVRGMVFRAKDGQEYILQSSVSESGSVWINGPTSTAFANWRSFVERDGLECVGVHPAYDRAACERFGVHGDAVAHGFARLRGGGSVDFREHWLPPGAVLHNGAMRVVAIPRRRAPLLKVERFVGIDARHARPEYIEQLCCGARKTADRSDPTSFTHFSAHWYRCSLAIGDHDTHEDIAVGVRWPANAEHKAELLIDGVAFASGTVFRHDGSRWVAEHPRERVMREMALVVLVNTVPAGLDPIGWRAAVLAVHECQSRYGSAIQGDHFTAWLMHSLREDIDDCDDGTPYAAGYHAYRRAIAPVAKVAPERKVKRTEMLSIRLPDDDDLGW